MWPMSDPYSPHEGYIQPAFRAVALWRVACLIVGFEIIFGLAPDLFLALMPNEATRTAYLDGISTFGTLAQFATFGVALVGFVILLNMLHGRGLRTVIGPTDLARSDLIKVTAAVSIVLFVIELTPPWYDLSIVTQVRPLGQWALLIPVTLAVLLIQVGTEEIVFRGYLQQQFACRSYRRWVWMGIPSVMFGVLHYWNGHGPAEGALWAFWAFLLGLACADLTARTGTIGAAVGLHLANNAFALLLYGIEGWPGSGVALFLFPFEDPATYADGWDALASPWAILVMLTRALSVYVMWLAARLALRR